MYKPLEEVPIKNRQKKKKKKTLPAEVVQNVIVNSECRIKGESFLPPKPVHVSRTKDEENNPDDTDFSSQDSQAHIVEKVEKTLDVLSTAIHSENLATTQTVNNPNTILDTIEEVYDESVISNYDPEYTARLLRETDAR